MCQSIHLLAKMQIDKSSFGLSLKPCQIPSWRLMSLSGLSIKGNAILNGPKCPSECARLSELFLLPRSVHLGFRGRRPRSNTEKPRSSSSSNKSRVLPEEGGRRRAGWGGAGGPKSNFQSCRETWRELLFKLPILVLSTKVGK